jgi:hypothetical protein
MTDLLDWAHRNGNYLVGLGEIALFLTLLLWKDRARFTARDAIICAVGSIALAAAFAYFPAPSPTSRRFSMIVADYMIFGEVTNGVTPLIALGYAFLLFALIKALGRSE